MESASLAGRTILIVEDEPLIAMEIVAALEKAGAAIVTAGTSERARRLVDTEALSAAVLDFGLPDGGADALCSRLNERGIPYVLHSGYTRFGDACHRGVVVPKPAKPAALIKVLVSSLEGHDGESSSAHHRRMRTP